MNVRSSAIGLACILGFYAAPALCHHAAIEFETDVALRYEGVIKEYVWANPHIRATLETRTESGVPITLEIEGNSPTTLRTMGVSADSLAPGDRVIATVSPSKRYPESSALGHLFTKEDGTVVPFTTNLARLSAEGARQPAKPVVGPTATSIFGVWVPQGGPGPLGQLARTWPLTAQGTQRFEDYTPLMSPQAQCVPTSAPWIMAYSAATVFEQQSDRITFKSDWMGAERTIYMDGRGHPPVEETFPQGHSVGHWDGSTLVVETTNFTDIIYAAIANGSRKRLVERIAVSADGKSLDYRFVMEDPEYLVGQVSGAIRSDYRPDLELEGLVCDRETAQRFFREFQ